MHVYGIRGIGVVATAIVIALAGAALDPAQSATKPKGREASEIVFTTHGAVQGSLQGSTYVYLGIPYAAPPIGHLRWKPPVSLVPWQGVRNASAFGQPCSQLDPAGAPIGSEDCLTLNVWAPVAPHGGLPVLFWIHGGGNAVGGSEQISSGRNIQDGAYLAEHGPAIVVTINYRLGPFGFLAHPSLSQEGSGVSGNYGTMDHLAALEWVQNNIQAFGGNPSKVTVFGESGGGLDACTLLAAPSAEDLMSRVIIQSGHCDVRPLAEAEAVGKTSVAQTSCANAVDVPACLRGLDAATLVRAMRVITSPVNPRDNTFGPNADGQIVTESPYESIRGGRHHKVPILIGSNREEGVSFVGAAPISDATYQALLTATFGSVMKDAIVARYPSSTYPSPRDALISVVTDVRFGCPVRRIARAAEASQGKQVYRYLFTASRESGTQAGRGAYHGAEVPFVFHTLTGPTASESVLQDAVVGYWTRFAESGNPKGNGTSWPKYEPQSDSYLELGYAIEEAAGVRTMQCDFWDSFVP